MSDTKNDIERMMEEAAAEVLNEAKEDAVIEESLNQDSGPSPTDADDSLEVPSYLDSDNDTAQQPEGESPDTQPVSESDLEFEYSVGGQTYKADKTQAIKALELQRGARQAFSDRAKLKREIKKLQREALENAEFRDKWKEALADPDPRAVFTKLTGQSLNDYVEQELQRRELWNRATPEERKILEYDQRMQAMQSQLEKFESTAREKEKALAEQSFQSEISKFQSEMMPVMEKAFEPLEHGNPEVDNTRWNMLWGATVRDLQKYAEEGYDVDRSLVKQVAQRNAKALGGNIAAQVDQGVEKVIEKKKAEAKDLAQKASTQNYTAGLSVQDAVKLNPLDLFHTWTGRK